MAEEMDVFGDPELFAEFEKPREPSDRLLLETLKSSKDAETDKQLYQGMVGTNTDEYDHAKFTLGSSDEESESDDDDNENQQESHAADLRKGSTENSNTENVIAQQGGSSILAENVGNNVSDNRGSSPLVINDLRREIERLKKENGKLRRQRRMIEPSRFEDDDGPALQIVYMNHKAARRYKTDIETFFTNLLTKDEEAEHEEKVFVPNIRSNSVCLVDEAENELSVEIKTHNIMACTAINCTQLYKNFIVDATGWPLVEGNPSMSEGWEHPLYSQVFTNALPYEEEEEDDGPGNPRDQRPKKACFNCGEEHDLRDCSLPRDFNRINQRKREFMNAKAASQTPKLQRYIRDGKDQKESKFDGFKAGIISDGLREALGLRENQLPPYIYQMRLLGYPPGHMMDAEIDGSGISMFDKHGKEVSIDIEEEEEEDGEVDPRDSSIDSKPGKYDTSKLIRYPGFNVEVPEGVADEHQRLGMPSMRPEHGIDVLEMFLTQQNASGTKRQLSDNGTPGSAKRQKTGYHSHDDESPAPSERKKLKAKRSFPREGSPSIEELQEQSSLIQHELAKVEGSKAEMVVMDSVGSEELSGEDGAESQDNSDDETASLSRQDTSLLNSFSDSMSTSSLSISHGTPIHKNSSGKRDSLPHPDKWRKDITEHIPFENLPGTTGNFERMNTLLGKHRKDRKSLTPKSRQSS